MNFLHRCAAEIVRHIIKADYIAVSLVGIALFDSRKKKHGDSKLYELGIN